MYTDLPVLHRFETFPPAKNREYWRKVAALERNAGLIAELKKGAAAAKDQPVPQLSAVDYMKFQRNGNRIDYELPYFARRYNLEALVITETLEHRGEYLDAIAEYLWHIDSELTWVLPAHARLDTPEQFARPGETLPPRELDVVDLFAAETASFLATTLTLLGEETKAASIEGIARACGVERIRVVDPYDQKAAVEALREEIAAPEPSLVISRAPCPLHVKKRLGPARAIDPAKCVGCKACLKCGCPSLELRDGGRPSVNATTCIGCGLCDQLCRFGALVVSG